MDGGRRGGGPRPVRVRGGRGPVERRARDGRRRVRGAGPGNRPGAGGHAGAGGGLGVRARGGAPGRAGWGRNGGRRRLRARRPPGWRCTPPRWSWPASARTTRRSRLVLAVLEERAGTAADTTARARRARRSGSDDRQPRPRSRRSIRGGDMGRARRMVRRRWRSSRCCRRARRPRPASGWCARAAWIRWAPWASRESPAIAASSSPTARCTGRCSGRSPRSSTWTSRTRRPRCCGKGDVLVAVDGQLITTRDGSARFSALPPDRAARLRIRRDGRLMELERAGGGRLPVDEGARRPRSWRDAACRRRRRRPAGGAPWSHPRPTAAGRHPRR